jgi:hypothetical protein
MEDILNVYQLPHDPRRPLVCMDEFSKQLLSETHAPRPTRPGKPAQYDSEYIREGSATAFMIYAPLEGKREIFITESATRTRIDYAHGDASLYKAFAPEKARRLAERFERHHTPLHGSWLNIAESEIAAVHRTHLDDRIPTADEFRHQCALASLIRNEKKAKTNWQFTNEDARVKLSSLYPSIQS